MNGLRGFFLLLLTILGLVVHAAPGEAFTRRIQVTGTSTSVGTCSIIIESFGLTKGGDAPSSLLPFNINVSIPNSSTAANSAILIRNDVDAALPADYVVTIPGGEPNIVRIDRSPGTFTMSISENVSGQTIAEDVAPLPGPPTWLLLLGGFLAIAGLFLLMRRERRGNTPA